MLLWQTTQSSAILHETSCCCFCLRRCDGLLVYCLTFSCCCLSMLSLELCCIRLTWFTFFGFFCLVCAGAVCNQLLYSSCRLSHIFLLASLITSTISCWFLLLILVFFPHDSSTRSSPSYFRNVGPWNMCTSRYQSMSWNVLMWDLTLLFRNALNSNIIRLVGRLGASCCHIIV